MVRLLLVGHVQICLVPFAGALLLLHALFERSFTLLLFFLAFAPSPNEDTCSVFISRTVTPPTSFAKPEIPRQRAGHGMIYGQRGGASVWPGRPAAHLGVVVRGQQVRGGVEGGGPRGLAEGKTRGGQSGTGHAPRAQGGAGLRVTPGAVGALAGTVLVMQGAPVPLGGRQRAGVEDGGGWDIFSAGEDGVSGIVRC